MPFKKNQKKINKNLKKTEAKAAKAAKSNPEYEIEFIKKVVKENQPVIKETAKSEKKRNKKGFLWIIGLIMPFKKKQQKNTKKAKPIKVKKAKAKKINATKVKKVAKVKESEVKVIKKHVTPDKPVTERKVKTQRKPRTEFKKQNRLIKNGYYNLLIAIVMLALALILIGTANFTPSDPNVVPADSNLVGNGFQVMVNNKISDFLSTQGYQNFKRLYVDVYKFSSAPLEQLIVGIIFLIILLPIFGGLALLLLLSGYFKKWLYT